MGDVVHLDQRGADGEDLNESQKQSFGVSDGDFLDVSKRTTLAFNMYLNAFNYARPFAGVS